MVAASSIGFVRHEGDIRKAGTVPLLRHPAHPCNTLAHVILPTIHTVFSNFKRSYGASDEV